MHGGKEEGVVKRTVFTMYVLTLPAQTIFFNPRSTGVFCSTSDSTVSCTSGLSVSHLNVGFTLKNKLA